jgi:hypothetical protein
MASGHEGLSEGLASSSSLPHASSAILAKLAQEWSIQAAGSGLSEVSGCCCEA